MLLPSVLLQAAPDSPSGSCSERPVKLNVGGQLFWTTTTTLSSTTGHVLARIFAADGSEGVHGTALLDDDGVPFIDRCAPGVMLQRVQRSA